MTRPNVGGPSPLPERICTVSLPEGLRLHVDLDGDAARGLASWLLDAPVSHDAVIVRDGDAWEREEGRAFSRPGEIHALLGQALILADALRVDQMRERSARLSGSPRIVRQGAPAMIVAIQVERLALRLSRYLERAVSGWHAERSPVTAVGNWAGETETRRAPGGEVARRTTVQKLLDAIDRARELLGNIPGAGAEVCHAYAALDQAYWQVFMVEQPDRGELMEEWNLWLCELVSMAYRRSFPIEVTDAHQVTRLDTTLFHPVTAGEIRTVLQRRPPPFLDQRTALATATFPPSTQAGS